MPVPADIGIVDTMIGFPAADFKQYDFIRKQLKDGSTDFEFPVEYMFKNVPKELYGAKDPISITLHEMDRYTALTTNRLCQTIEVVDQDGLIEELAGVEKALLSKAIIDHYPRLPVGRHCRIISGPMMGTEGVVIERKNAKARMAIEVTILGQGAVVEIDSDLLEPME